MSSSIWTRCAGDSRLRELRLAPWRVVEAQHHISTRKLVDSAEEQELLEELIERVKPPDATRGKLHYLLSTPFRYPPLHHGSRFGGRRERGIWYGSEDRRTAFAEVAYYRLVFLEGTRAALGTLTTALTAFTVRVRSPRGVDLAAAPFDAFRATIASATRYDATQTLGARMRSAGVELFRYPSARDAEGGINIAALSPTVFGRAKPLGLETWHCTAAPSHVEMARADFLRRERFTFPREQFLVDSELPAPAL
ncbi:MAG: RES family NAD+ phosphorylase [bacterium]